MHRSSPSPAPGPEAPQMYDVASIAIATACLLASLGLVYLLARV
jgi:hypothetical protein